MTMAGEIRDFSNGYYSIELRVMAYEDGPTIDSSLFRYIEDQLYSNTNAPVWMRAGMRPSPHFRLYGHEPMPTDLIGLPVEYMEELDVPDDDTYHSFFISKPEHAHFFSQSALWSNFSDREDDDV